MLQQQTAKMAAAGIALWVLVAAGLAQGEGPVRLAILPIVVHSADDPTYLRNGLADMLASRVEQSGRFEVIRVVDLESATTLLSKAIEAGRAVGADFVLFGSFTRFGTGASLDMQCVSTHDDYAGESLREIFVHTGSIGEVIPDLDELVGKVGRFAIDGFDSGVDVASGPPAAGRAGNDSAAAERAAALEARIQKLEKAVADLTAGLETAHP